MIRNIYIKKVPNLFLKFIRSGYNIMYY